MTDPEWHMNCVKDGKAALRDCRFAEKFDTRSSKLGISRSISRIVDLDHSASGRVYICKPLLHCLLASLIEHVASGILVYTILICPVVETANQSVIHVSCREYLYVDLQ
jgi:hypothetical protein